MTTSVASALREWALAAPHRYLLIFGTPVPGYAAPPEATDVAASIMGTLLDAVTATARAADAARAPGTAPLPPPSGALPPAGGALPPAAAAAVEHLATHRRWAREHPAPPALLHAVLVLWTRLHGVISLELAGHFTTMGFDPARLYAAEVESVLQLATTPVQH